MNAVRLPWRDMEKKRSFQVGKRNLLLLLVMAVEILYHVWANWKWGILHLDSDDSAEMILAELLSRTGELVTDKWYYSTELRVLNTQIVMSALFRLSSDWRAVRAAGTGVLLCCLACSYLVMCKSLRLGDKLIWLAPLILWPFSEIYYDFVLYGLYYIPHLCIIFLTLGLSLNESEKFRRTRTVLLVILAFLAGCGGRRMLAVCYLPLFGASVVLCGLDLVRKREWDRKVSLRVLTGFVACVLGCVVNDRFLKQKYSFWDASKPQFVSPQPSKLIPVLKSVGSLLGIRTYMFRTVWGIPLLIVCAAFVFMAVRILLNWKSLPRESQTILLFFASSFGISAVVPVLTTTLWAARYMLLPGIGFVFLIAVYFDRFPIRLNSSKVLCLVLILFELVSGISQFKWFAQTNVHAVKDGAYRYVMDSGLEFGFGDWDASDILTEMSNGRIHLCKILDFKEPGAWYWLMEKDFSKYARGKPVFFIMDNAKMTFSASSGGVVGEWTREDLTYLDKGTVVYQDEYYTVYRYDSYEEFEEITGKTF